jgi:enediyne biosynthesis protein E4
MSSYQLVILICLLGTSCGKKQLLFRQLSEKETGIRFINRVKQTEAFNILTYPYLFNGAGVAVGDINNDGWQDLFFSGNHKATNRLYLNKGNLHSQQTGFTFDDITESAGIQGKSDWCTGVTMVDINADGWLDIYISTVSIPGLLNSHNELYINNHNGTFTERAAEYGLDFKCHTTQTAFFDYDNDGDLDAYLLNHAVTYSDDYSDTSTRANKDPFSGDKLLQNSKGRFTEVTAEAGIYSSNNGYGLGIAVGDMNNDGWTDIYVSNDFKENDFCYINMGNGRFEEKAKTLFPHMSRFSMGNDMADYNNDGWLDVVTLDMLSPEEKIVKSSVADDDIEVYDYKQHFGFNYQFSKNCLHQNIGGVYFSDISLQKGVAATDWSWAPLLADFNNDGNKDMFISNGFRYRVNDLDFNIFVQGTLIRNQQQNIATNKFELIKQIPGGAVPDYFYINKNEQGFENASAAAGFIKPTLSNGSVYADLDNDGDLDLVVNRIDEPPGIYKNNMAKKNYLQLTLTGTGNNTFGIGTMVYVYAGATIQLFNQSPVKGFMSSVSPVIHIGLGANTKVDSLIVRWPGGKGEKLTNIPANQAIQLKQENAGRDMIFPGLKKYITESWQDYTDTSGIHFLHKEDEFNDLNVQPFLPHSLATQGPRLAAGDVNNDGWEDVYVCGAKNQAGQLYLQNGKPAFALLEQPTFNNDSAYEDTDAIFFDADNDKDLDLYVSSGGNELFGRQEYLKDRLYINDGKGRFQRNTTLPDLYENKSCVRPCDFDKDGDIDLFAGGRANARMYGYMPASVILENDGKGNFTEATEKIAGKLLNVGMVTDACWADIEKDGWMDLIIVGEWMPVTVFKNVLGKLVKQEPTGLKNTAGWWNCIYATDIDEDGDQDFLLGNWGLNSKLTATAEHPLKLYLADWDNNKEIDPILAVCKNNKYYPFLGKTDLEKRLPYLKKQFLKYQEIAGKTMEEIFSTATVEQSKILQAHTLASSVLLNENDGLVLKPLPAFLQTAPLFSFATVNTSPQGKEWIAGGNFYEVLPYEGRYDALLPAVFSYRYKEIILKEYLPEKGAIRDIHPVLLKNAKTVLLLVRNNDRLSVVKKIQ